MRPVRFEQPVTRALAALSIHAALVSIAAVLPAAARPEGISGAGACALDAVNADAASAVAAVFQLRRHGSSGGPEVRSLLPIAPRRHATLDLADADLMPGAWSAIAAGTGPIGVVRRCSWPASGGAIAGGAARDGTVLAAPFVRQAGRDEAAIVSIQNADESSTATVQLAVHDGGPAPVLTQAYAVNPGAAVTLDTSREPALAALPDVGLGAIVLRSDRPIAGDLIVDLTTSARGAADASLQRAEDAATTLLLPRLRRGTDGDGSRVQLVNAGQGAGEVRLRVVGGSGACAGSDAEIGPVPVPAMGAAEIDLVAAASGLPEGCVAAGVLSSTVGVLGTVLETAGAGRDAGAYEAQPHASSRRALYAPRWTASGGSTLDLFNPGPDAADVVLTVLGPDGAPVACRAGCALALPPGRGARVAAADLDDDLADDAVGALIVEGSSPVAGVLGEGGPGTFADLSLQTLVGLDPPGEPAVPERRFVPLLLAPLRPPTPTSPWSPTPSATRANRTPTPDGTPPTPTATPTPSATSSGPVPNEPSPSPTGPTPTPGSPAPTEPIVPSSTPDAPPTTPPAPPTEPTAAASETPTPDAGGPTPPAAETGTATPTEASTEAPTTVPTPLEPTPTAVGPGASWRVYLPWGAR